MPAARRTSRGLVLGGGGVLGAAWMVGALSALEEVHGLDVRDSDVIVGTSAGSIIGALLAAGVSVSQLVAHQRGEQVKEGPLAGYSFDYERAVTNRPGRPKMLAPASAKMIVAGLSGVGRMPPTAVMSGFLPAGSASLARVGHLIDAITPMDEWSPHPNFWAVAMDYESGRRVPFGKPTEPVAPLSKAVMASCAIPGWFEPVEINGRLYVDGGTWSATSADLLEPMALDEVFVVAPMVSFHLDRPRSVLTKLERRWRGRVTKRCLREVERLRAGGADVTVIGPGPEDLEAIGANLMDVPRRLKVLETATRTARAALQDPENVGPDHVAEVG